MTPLRIENKIFVGEFVMFVELAKFCKYPKTLKEFFIESTTLPFLNKKRGVTDFYSYFDIFLVDGTNKKVIFTINSLDESDREILTKEFYSIINNLKEDNSKFIMMRLDKFETGINEETEQAYKDVVDTIVEKLTALANEKRDRLEEALKDIKPPVSI